MMWRSVKIKYSVLTLGIGLATGVGLLFFLLRSTQNLLDKSLEQRAVSLARSAAHQAEYGLLIGNMDLLKTVLQGVSEEDDFSGGIVYSIQGDPVAVLGKNLEKNWVSALPVMDVHQNDYVGRWHARKEVLVDVAVPVWTSKSELLGDDLLSSAVHEPTGQLGSVRLLFSPRRTRVEIRRSVWRSLLWLIPLLSLAFVGMLVNVQRLVNPILKLAQASRLVSKGVFQPIADVNRRDELGELWNAFNQMIININQSRQELERWNKELEQRVEERSRDLQTVQERLAQSSKMAALGQLAGGVAHEINNPLEVIQGFAARLSKHFQKDDPRHFEAQSILRESDRCRKLIQDLLIFTRSRNTEMEEINLNDALPHALLLLGAQEKFKEVRFESKIAAEPLVIRANKDQILQIVLNFANNSLHAMPNSGTITVRTSREENGGHSWAKLEFSDTGTGIPVEIQKRIFEPFYTTKEVGQGTGLGLSIVYELVRLQGGRIDFESHLNQGTTFFIHWPLVMK